ncbi:MAG TPA: glycosyltransferase [Candidatus Saccharimonadales bacterium]|nr:glycosyltransferase [Candidatus Saccharimonadales bacterium]
MYAATTTTMKQLISYVLPVHNEAGNIQPLYHALSEATQSLDYNFEFIFVNDGSTDLSLEQLQQLHATDPRVVVINFARNFGHQIAVTAGLDYARGDAIIIMDADLQDPPKVSAELIATWQQGWDVVYAKRRTRQDGFFKRATAKIFYWLLRRLADIDIPQDTGDFRLVSRRVVDALKQFNEHNRFLRGLVSYVGFKQTYVLFDRDKRYSGTTSYPLKKMIRFAADGIFSFSWAPLKLIGRVGYFISALAFIGALYALAVRIVVPEDVVPGWAFTVIAISLIGGIQLIMLSVLGGYIGRIYTEVQNRPLYIIESVTSDQEDA